jgi:outer membrane protein TolC
MFFRRHIISGLMVLVVWLTAARSMAMEDLLAQAPKDVGAVPAGFNAVPLEPSAEPPKIEDLQSGAYLPSVVSMEDAVQWALQHNHDMQRLRYLERAAESKVREADLLNRPVFQYAQRLLTAGPGETAVLPLPNNPIDLVISTTDPIMTLTLSVTQPVYTFGAIPLARRASALGLDAARLQLARGEETMRNDVETAFLQAALTKSLADVASQAVDTSQARLKIAQDKFDAGTAAKFEVLRSEVSLSTSRDQLLQAQTAADLAMSALAQKLGLMSGTEIGIEPPDPKSVEAKQPSMSLDDARKAAIANRSDLKAMQRALDLAAVGIESSRNRPTVGFQGSYTMADHAVGFQQLRSWSLVLNMSFTVFDSGRAHAAMAEGRSNRDALKESYEQTKSLVSLQVENAYHSLVNSLDRIDVANTTLDAASEAVRIAQIGYKEGVTPYIDYQDADLSYRQAETMYLQAVYGYLIAESNLVAVMGAGERSIN